MTARLYLDDPYLRTFEAEVLDSEAGWSLLSRTTFYPGGGGQPADRGHVQIGERSLPVTALREEPAGGIWHQLGCDLAAGGAVRGEIDWPYRHALMRHHGLMHVVNTVARERFGAAMTGVQLGPDRSRIDLKLGDFARERVADLEAWVNEAIERDLPLHSSVISEEEFRARPELIRTLNVKPPVIDGRVRIVEIQDFDAQACGGTHVHSTREIGRARVVKVDNKGKDNRRFYWECGGPAGGR